MDALNMEPQKQYWLYGLDAAAPTMYEALKLFARVHRAVPTEAEDVLWQHLRGSKLGHKFRRQHILGPFIADFVCLEKRLVIEVDGLIHQLPENQMSDEHRTAWLISRSFAVIRFTNDQVLHDIASTIQFIQHQLTLLPPTNTRSHPSSRRERGRG